ncbi:MAG: MASE1 domain-containing protein [Anaerolineae bacterium]|nr:MASE1 domain-containing protein [Anaerolineae bacterium]
MGLSLASFRGIVTLVWPPTGVALAALLLFGYRLWPGIALGALLVNLSAGASLAAVGISLGNTLEAVVGAYLLNRIGLRYTLERLRDVLSLVFLGAMVSPMISAAIGAASLGLTGAMAWADYGSVWWVWWLGDAMGALVVAPALLIWGYQPRLAMPLRQVVEAVGLLAALVIAGELVFGGFYISQVANYPLAYIIFPFVIWAAFRFGQRGAVTATLVAAGLAVWGTAQGVGPFVQGTIEASLLLLHGFVSTMAITALLLAAALAERNQAEEALKEQRAFLRQVIDINPHLIFAKDRAGRFTLANQAVADVFGTTIEEILGKTDADFNPETAQNEHFRRDDLDVMNTLQEKFITEEYITDAAGRIRWLQTIKRPIPDNNGGAYQVLGVATDITAHRQAQEELQRYKEYLEELVKERTLELTEAVKQLEREITERRQAEESLRESEERFHRLSDATFEGIVIHDQGQILDANQSFALMVGYELAEVKGKNVLGFATPEYRDLIMQHVQSDYEKPYEVMGLKKDGSTFPAEIWAKIIPYQGRMVRVAAIRDVTERKQIEAVLQATLAKTEALYRISQSVVLAESLPDLLQTVVDSVVTAVPANRAALIIFDLNRREATHFISSGLGSEQIVAVPFEELWQGLSGWVLREKQPALSPQGLPDERESWEVRRRRAETNCGAVMVAPLLYRDNILGTLTAINRPEERDFTSTDLDLLLALANQAAVIFDHKQAEETLLRQNEFLEALHQITLDLLNHREMDDLLQALVDSAATLLDAPYGELMLKEGDELVVRAFTQNQPFLLGDRIARGEALLSWQAHDTGQPAILDDYSTWAAYRAVYNGVHLRAVADFPIMIGPACLGVLTLGRDEPDYPFKPEQIQKGVLLSQLAALILDSANLYNAALREITERKQAEAALRQQAAELQARNEELDAFAHTVAHDLKVPLGPITGYADILIEDDALLTPNERQKYLQIIARSGRKMNSIIGELLLLASVRKKEVKSAPLDMAGIVAEAQQRLAHLIEEHQAEIILPAVWPVALGYAPWIEEVWANYLSNAIKYGGRPPRLELGATVVGQATSLPDGEAQPASLPMVRFWVHDNGPGLSLAAQQQLFTPFTQLGQVRAEGQGLGLSIVRRIVEKLGGEVGVESDGIPGRGSIFSFTLPQAPV